MNAVRTIKTHTMTLQGTLEQIFPLLCPIREYDWIEPWSCGMVYTASGVAELDCIFKTHFPDDGPEDTWVVSRYEPPRRVEFVRFNVLRVMRYSITLSEADDGSTSAEWQQIITGLNDEGNQVVATLNDDVFHTEMQLIERMLNHYLEYGAPLKLDDPGKYRH